MKFFQTATALALASLLAACGGQANTDMPMQLASVTTSSSAAQVASAAAAAAPAGVSVASETMPAPDCAAEGCASLRIIDGNAEAWRIDAQRRAAADAELAQL